MMGVEYCRGCGLPGYGSLCPVCAGEPCPSSPAVVPEPVMVRLGDDPLPTWKRVLISAAIFGLPVVFFVVLRLAT